MEAIVTQVDILSTTANGFIDDIQAAKNNLEEKYYKLTKYFWVIFAGNIVAVLVVIALSVKLFFGSALDNNYNIVVVATYQKVKKLEDKFNLITNDYEKSKKIGSKKNE
ncbi:hypothetical protein [Photorhabdus sp. SF281]|uniref:hypothetical protein n=1 Tax=Photorhabdus sp. SF281 TaxID=3459527 RepID=UPI004044D0D8